MRLSQEAIEDFKRIYKKEFGKEISSADAHDLGIRLLLLIEAVYRHHSPPSNPPDSESKNNPAD